MEKIILITGATSGIGKATALELMRTDSKVIISARNASSGEAVRAEFRALSAAGTMWMCWQVTCHRLRLSVRLRMNFKRNILALMF